MSLPQPVKIYAEVLVCHWIVNGAVRAAQATGLLRRLVLGAANRDKLGRLVSNSPGPPSLLESLGFAQSFLSSCKLEALHFIGIRSFGEEFREDVVFRGIQEKFGKPLA
jgi:hypothetical protein